MTKRSRKLTLSPDQRDHLVQNFSDLLTKNLALQQALQTQKDDSTAAQELLFLELLEIFDSFDMLLTSLTEHQDSLPLQWKRWPKSLASLQKKLLGILERRQVTLIKLQEGNPDFTFCQVVEENLREERHDETSPNHFKVIRQGFKIRDRLLRPAEVIKIADDQGQ